MILDSYALINEVIQFQSFFFFANLWAIINALEGLYKHIRVDICSFNLSIYFFTFLSIRALSYSVIFHAFLDSE